MSGAMPLLLLYALMAPFYFLIFTVSVPLGIQSTFFSSNVPTEIWGAFRA